MATVSMNIKLDAEVKKQAQELFEGLGLSMSAAINVFLRQAIKENAIPFRVGSDPFYSEANQRYLKQVIKDIETGKSELKEHELLEDNE